LLFHQQADDLRILLDASSEEEEETRITICYSCCSCYLLYILSALCSGKPLSRHHFHHQRFFLCVNCGVVKEIQ